MNTISEKDQKELDKIISIARKYRDNTISESMFLDVAYSIKADKNQILDFKEYIRDRNIIFISGDYEVEDFDERIDDSAKMDPYDMTNIDISPKPLTIDMIIARLENDEIDLLPDFQRKAGLWSAQQKSQLIESLILRIPLPAFYFDGSNNDRWIVIDGLQRLTALKEFFVDKTLSLSDLEFLQDLNNTKIDDMPRAYERRMKETQVTAYIINPGAPVSLKYNIFKRINTGGLRLEPQEIRHALYQGYATRYIKELAELSIFMEATGYSIKTERMLDREFVLRFIAFYEQGLTLYSGAIELFLNDAMEIINKKYDPVTNDGHAESIKELFIEILKLNSTLFGRFAFRKMPDKDKRRPISKALFETWMTCLAKLPPSNRQALLDRKGALVDKYMTLYNDNPGGFVDSLGSAKISSVRKRFDVIQGLIAEVLGNAG